MRGSFSTKFQVSSLQLARREGLNVYPSFVTWPVSSARSVTRVSKLRWRRVGMTRRWRRRRRRRRRRRERRWWKSSGKEEGRSRRILNVTRGNCRSVRGCKVRDTRDKRTRIKCRHSNRLSGTRGCLGVITPHTNDSGSRQRARDFRIRSGPPALVHPAVNRARSVRTKGRGARNAK